MERDTMTFEQYANLEHFAQFYEKGALSSAFIAEELKITQQHARRLLKGLRPPKKRFAWNRLGFEIRQFVIETKKEHGRYNCQWISELASDKFGRSVSQSSVHRILSKENLLNCPPPERKARSRFEAEKCGDLVQMDTTWGYWLDGKRLCLILLLDDYSRYILHARFVLHDTADANMAMIRETVEKYGTFRLLYTDNASFFKPIRHNEGFTQLNSKTEYESNITRACRELGITHITHKPYEPQSKGKIERLFRFIQERLIDEEIVDDPSYLPLYVAQKKLNRWIEWYNEKHVNRTTRKTPKERFDPNGFTPLPADKCLDDIFCLKDSRKVDACNEFSYQGVRYAIPTEHNMVGCKVQLHILPERSIRVWHMEKFVCEIPMRPKGY